MLGWDMPVKIWPAGLETAAREAILGPGGRTVLMRRVAVLGTGIMGAGMARSVLRSGLDVTVWNRSPGRAAPLAADGAQVAGGRRKAERDIGVVCGTAAGAPKRAICAPAEQQNAAARGGNIRR